MIGQAYVIPLLLHLNAPVRPRGSHGTLLRRMSETGTDRPQFEAVHHVLVGVPPDQKEAAKRFYEDVLGFVPVASPLESGGSGNLWWYECGASELHVALVPDYHAHVRPHVAIRVKDLPALRERLRRHGIETTL